MRASLLIVAIAALALGFVAGQAFPGNVLESVGISPVGPSNAPPMAVVPVSTLKPLPADLDLGPEETRDVEVFRRATLSVVNITSVAYQRNWFSLDVYRIPQGSGSGFIWDRKGHVVTNYHVIQGGQTFLVTLADQSTWEATVVGEAPHKDLAVLKIEAPAEQLHPLPLGRSADLVVGQRVLAVGNPFGLDHSLTVGVLSAMGRELKAPDDRTIRDVLQTDAAINPGNSGGPLLDSRGRLVGVNSAIYSPSGAFAGIGFAIPVDTVSRLIPPLIQHGRPIQPGIGVGLVPPHLAARFDLQGIIVAEVAPGGPAEQAGLEGSRIRRGRRGWEIVGGDQIAAVNGEAVSDADDLLHAFEQAGVGREVTLTLVRNGRTREVEVTLAALD